MNLSTPGVVDSLAHDGADRSDKSVCLRRSTFVRLRRV